MPSANTNLTRIQEIFKHIFNGVVCKWIITLSLFLFFFYAFFFNSSYDYFTNVSNLNLSVPPSKITTADVPTDSSHIMFVLVGCLRTWKNRKAYIEAWWRSNITRGNIFLDEFPTQDFLPWPSTSPPFHVNEDITKLKIYPKLLNPVEVRIYRSILDAFRLGPKDIRWFVMADDDTLFFVDNLVEVLGMYDHNKYYYIGGNSELVKSNYDFSFDMGYGGAGYALSYAFVERLVGKMDACIERYPYLYVSDQLSSFCSADLGVDLTLNKGIHQIDLLGDISGLLSSHPSSPLLTLHHFDSIQPIFPSKTRVESINHLMKAANIDQSRLLQQTICYQRQNNWTFSVSWGYSVHIYQNILPRTTLKRPIETFRPWKKGRPPLYMFNTRWPSNDTCEAPHVYFLESVMKENENENENENVDVDVITTYLRNSKRDMLPCLSSGNHSADHITEVQVFAPKTRKKSGIIECCDVEYMSGTNIADVRIRSCMEDEVLA